VEDDEERLIDVSELVSQLSVERQRGIGSEIGSDLSSDVRCQLLRRLRRRSDDAIGEPEEDDDL
jgi:hypothetical protein